MLQCYDYIATKLSHEKTNTRKDYKYQAFTK